jgi:hypothetical protein
MADSTTKQLCAISCVFEMGGKLKTMYALAKPNKIIKIEYSIIYFVLSKSRPKGEIFFEQKKR